MPRVKTEIAPSQWHFAPLQLYVSSKISQATQEERLIFANYYISYRFRSLCMLQKIVWWIEWTKNALINEICQANFHTTSQAIRSRHGSLHKEPVNSTWDLAHHPRLRTIIDALRLSVYTPHNQQLKLPFNQRVNTYLVLSQFSSSFLKLCIK